MKKVNSLLTIMVMLFALFGANVAANAADPDPVPANSSISVTPEFYYEWAVRSVQMYNHKYSRYMA